MSWLVPKLRHRIQIQKPVQDPNSYGGFDRTYETILTVWAEVKPVSQNRGFIEAIRGEALTEAPTHQFMVRTAGVQNLGRAYNRAFATSHDGIEDLSPLKSEYFIFLQKGSTTKGRLFRIRTIQRDEVRTEWTRILGEEIEEQGTGWKD